MLSVAEARAVMVAALSPLPNETIALEAACNRVLATPVIANRDQPPFNASAMDGYAFAHAALPRDLQIVGESAAGLCFNRPLDQDEAVRISTGAPIPEGANAVLLQEDANIAGSRLIAANAAAGRHVRSRGIDFKAGETLLGKGRRLNPIDIALIASTGRAEIEVAREPRLIVLASGEEIVPPGQAAAPDQIFESASFAIQGLGAMWGASVRRGKSLPDNAAAIKAALAADNIGADLTIIIGGASVGPHDHARAAAMDLGFRVLVEKVAVRPGKPTWFAHSSHGAILGLPGNPASAIVCAALFLRPIIEALSGGEPDSVVSPRLAALAAPLAANGPRETYLRALLSKEGSLRAFEDQDSSLLRIFSQANALIVRPAHAPALDAGALAPYLSIPL